MKLYRMQEQLAFVAAEITDSRDQARARAKKLKEVDPLVKMLEAYANKLDDLHDKLVSSKREREAEVTGECMVFSI